MKYSIIMPCYIVNRELLELTANAFQSLQKTTGLGRHLKEVITIDNGSPMGGDYLHQVSDICIRNSNNLGYPKAVNQGFKLATGDAIVVANNDIKVSPNWLVVANEIFERDEKKEVGSIHYQMLSYDEKPRISDKVWFTGKERWCSSSFFVIRKEAIPDGGYDERYGLGGGEDWDYWYRVRQNGWRTAYTNGAYYQHKHSSTSNLRDKKEREESDRKAAELFKEKFGDTRENVYNKLYPNQMNKPWLPFP